MKKSILFLLAAISAAHAFAKPVSGPLKYLRLQAAVQEAAWPVEFEANGHIVKILTRPMQLALSDRIYYGEISDEIQSLLLEPQALNFFSFTLTAHQLQICNAIPFESTQRLCIVGEGLSLERYLAAMENHNDSGINLKIATARGRRLTLGFATVAEFREFFSIPLKKSHTIRNALAACAAALVPGTPVVPSLTVHPDLERQNYVF